MPKLRPSQSEERKCRRLGLQKMRFQIHRRSLHSSHEVGSSGKTLGQRSACRRGRKGRNSSSASCRRRNRLNSPISWAIHELFFNIVSKLVFNVKAKATVRLKFSPKQRQIILNSLKPEILNPASHRSRAKLYTENGMVILQIEANDSTALRASLNSYLRWINSILNVLETLKAHQQLCE